MREISMEYASTKIQMGEGNLPDSACNMRRAGIGECEMWLDFLNMRAYQPFM